MEDIPGYNVAPGLPMPRQAIDWLICSSIFGLVEDLSSLDWLLLMACAKGPHTLKNTKNSKSPHKAASPQLDLALSSTTAK